MAAVFDPDTLLPRDQWEGHPHWSTQTLLLVSHESFRGWSGWILDRVRALDLSDDSRARHRKRKLGRLADDFHWWMRGMKGHERYEENKLYPFLAGRWGATFGHLEQGHRTLDIYKRRAERAFEQVAPGTPEEATQHQLLIDALQAHRGVLFAHLAEEEELVIPLLLELSPDEFRDLTTLPAPALLARFS